MKSQYRTFLKVTPFIIVVIFLLYSSFTNRNEEGFAIYLTKDDIDPTQIPILSHVEINNQPIISLKDIIEYDSNTHEIALTPKAFIRISNLEVPVKGKIFMVCVDKEPIYAGAFWTPISSISFDGVTIWKPLISDESNIIKLELGYPSPDFYGGEDPRVNVKIMESLKRVGKLTNEVTLLEIDRFPNSMKGYELYSWLEDSQWHFTLITGTNRIKTLEEIISTVSIVTHDGWVQIHVVGVEAIKDVLSKVPQFEEIIWFSELPSGQTPQNDILISLPELAILEILIEHSDHSGVDLLIQYS